MLRMVSNIELVQCNYELLLLSLLMAAGVDPEDWTAKGNPACLTWNKCETKESISPSHLPEYISLPSACFIF